MSQLDELIAEFCPNGVEYKTIDEIAVDIYRGSGIKRDQVTEEGNTIVCVMEKFIQRTVSGSKNASLIQNWSM